MAYRILYGDFGVFPPAQKVINRFCYGIFEIVFVLARFMVTAFALAVANIIIVFHSRVARAAARRHTIAAVAAKGFARQNIRLYH